MPDDVLPVDHILWWSIYYKSELTNVAAVLTPEKEEEDDIHSEYG